MRPCRYLDVLLARSRLRRTAIKLEGSIQSKENQDNDNDNADPEDHASDVRAIPS